MHIFLCRMIQTVNIVSIEIFINQPRECLTRVYFKNLADLHIFRDH